MISMEKLILIEKMVEVIKFVLPEKTSVGELSIVDGMKNLIRYVKHGDGCKING